jgi:hypothetical protein
MTTIINEMSKEPSVDIKLGVGDWVLLTNKKDKTTYLCVIAQISAGQIQLISISEDEANRLLPNPFDWRKANGAYHNFSFEQKRLFTLDDEFTFIKLDVTISYTRSKDA